MICEGSLARRRGMVARGEREVHPNPVPHGDPNRCSGSAALVRSHGEGIPPVSPRKAFLDFWIGHARAS